MLFADDTNVLFSNADLIVLQDTLNSELEKVSNWLIDGFHSDVIKW